MDGIQVTRHGSDRGREACVSGMLKWVGIESG